MAVSILEFGFLLLLAAPFSLSQPPPPPPPPPKLCPSPCGSSSSPGKCVVPLDMARNSLDDQYIGCEDNMSNKVKSVYLGKELADKKIDFKTGWNFGIQYMTKNPHPHLTLEQATAIYAYTMNTPLFCQFNTAVRNGGGSNYNTFPFKALHFYLTTALTILHREQNSGCRDVFRGETISRTVKVGEIVRFSQFASCSVDKDRAKSFAGKDGTVFSINTCQGVPITEYSSKKYEEEVLIPPYEKFKVQSVKGNEITLSAVKGDTKSVNNCLAVP